MNFRSSTHKWFHRIFKLRELRGFFAQKGLQNFRKLLDLPRTAIAMSWFECFRAFDRVRFVDYVILVMRRKPEHETFILAKLVLKKYMFCAFDELRVFTAAYTLSTEC